MKKHPIFLVLITCWLASCEMLGLGEKSAPLEIKNFKWTIDTVYSYNTTFIQGISGASITDMWLSNGAFDAGIIKVLNNNIYYSSSTSHVGKVEFYNGAFYGGGFYNLKRLSFDNNYQIKSIEPALKIERSDTNFKLGKIADLIVGADNELVLLCTYENEDLMPSYTTIQKWNGDKSNVVFTSSFGVQGHKLIEGKNGLFFKGFKSEYEGTFVMREFDVVVGIQTDIGGLFIVANQQRDYLSLGKIGDEVFLKYNEDLFALNDGNMIPTGIRFPENTFGFTGYSKNNLLATGVGGYFVYDGASWEQLPLPINTNTENRIGEPLLMRDGVVNVITQRPLSTTFYLVRGSPK
jgi:hypothetical protein